jgi:hypothetical protein
MYIGVAMSDHGHSYDYPPVVRLQINDAKRDEYARAADSLNAEKFDLVCLQREVLNAIVGASSKITAAFAEIDVLWSSVAPIPNLQSR